jgi:hypothetical protein
MQCPGDDCISIVNASSTIKMKTIYCGPGHGIRYYLDLTLHIYGLGVPLSQKDLAKMAKFLLPAKLGLKFLQKWQIMFTLLSIQNCN